MIISIDGLIGSGKSTVLELLETKYGRNVHLEPVDEWMPYLERFYRDPRSAFLLQTRVWTDRCMRPPLGIENDVFIERSPLFQWQCFVLGNVGDAGIDLLEKEVLSKLYGAAGERWRPDLYIYLRCDPLVAAERIAHRARSVETDNGIKLEYLQELYRRHEEAAQILRTHGIPLFIIEVEDKTSEDVAEEVLECVRRAKELKIPASGDHQIPVPANLVYNAFQVLDWVANWNREDDDYNPPPSLCKTISEELRARWASP